jgi:hypothetical protein
MSKQTVYLNEADVKKKVKKLLDNYKWFWWMPPANGFGKSGISDFNAIRGGVFLAIETKFGSNKPTAMQQAFLRSVQMENGFSFVVNEKNIEHLNVWLQAFDSAVKAQMEQKEVAHEDGAAMLNAIHALTIML